MPAISDVLEFRFVTRGANASNQINVRHYRVVGVTGVALTDQQVCDGICSLYGSNIKPLIPTFSAYVGAFMRRVTPTVGVQLTSLNGAGPGTRVGSPMSPQCCPVVTLRCALAPPRTRGRVYVPPGCNTDTTTDSGSATAGYIAAVQAFAASLFGADIPLNSGANTTTLRPVVLKRKPSPLDYQITTVTTRTYIATQRRRSSVHGADRPLL